MPAFYNHPQSVGDIVNHIVVRVLDQFGFSASFAKRWSGQMRKLKKYEERGRVPVNVD
jgi:3-polyprenyl-4-hydroxybenzoate decarboxylase